MPRFEIKSIRSWSDSRRERAEGRGNGSADRHAETGELRGLLEAYDHRFEETAIRERDDAERTARFREDARQLLDAVIVPALDALGTEITEHGHGWNVESRIDILGQPAVGSSFLPREIGRSGRAASELSFRFQLPDRLTITAVASDGRQPRELAPKSYEMSKVTPEIVRGEIVRFVRGVLDETD